VIEEGHRFAEALPRLEPCHGAVQGHQRTQLAAGELPVLQTAQNLGIAGACTRHPDRISGEINGNHHAFKILFISFYVERIEELSQEPDAFIDYAVIATQQQIASIHVGKGPARRTLQVFRILDPKAYYLDLHPAFDGAFLDAVHHLLSA